MSRELTMGERIDAISARMSAAYAARRETEPGTAEYVAADDRIEAVYHDLRHLNAEMSGQHVTGGVTP